MRDLSGSGMTLCIYWFRSPIGLSKFDSSWDLRGGFAVAGPGSIVSVLSVSCEIIFQGLTPENVNNGVNPWEREQHSLECVGRFKIQVVPSWLPGNTSSCLSFSRHQKRSKHLAGTPRAFSFPRHWPTTEGVYVQENIIFTQPVRLCTT